MLEDKILAAIKGADKADALKALQRIASSLYYDERAPKVNMQRALMYADLHLVQDGDKIQAFVTYAHQIFRLSPDTTEWTTVHNLEDAYDHEHIPDEQDPGHSYTLKDLSLWHNECPYYPVGEVSPLGDEWFVCNKCGVKWEVFGG